MTAEEQQGDVETDAMQSDECRRERPQLIGLEHCEVICAAHKDQRRKVIEHIGAGYDCKPS
jgi:hypothetical protein